MVCIEVSIGLGTPPVKAHMWYSLALDLSEQVSAFRSRLVNVRLALSKLSARYQVADMQANVGRLLAHCDSTTRNLSFK
jgi:hypothetical protein